MIPYGHQSISAEDKQAVLRTMDSDFLTQGPEVENFEKALCEYTGAKYCVCVANGTAALHIAVAALDIPLGAEGITTPITFAASANCMIYSRLRPVFADIDPVSYCLSAEKTAQKLTEKTKLLIPVHYAGAVCDMKKFRALADSHGLRIIEDAAHAIGSKYADGSKVGCCMYSDMTIFSFHPVKTITCGEGGAVMTNDPDLYAKLLKLRSHGITKLGMSQNPGPWYYEMQMLGFNYRITEIQAALGRSQLTRIEQFAQRRRDICRLYNESFQNKKYLQTPELSALDLECRHLYPLCIDFDALKISRAGFMEKLRMKGIGSQVHYIPVYSLPYYQKTFGGDCGPCPNAEMFYKRELSLPLFPDLSNEDARMVVNSVLEIIG